MPNSHHVTEFAGLPVVEFHSWDTIRDDLETAMYWARNRSELHEERPRSYRRLLEAIADPGSVAWRLRTELSSSHGSGESLQEYMHRFSVLVGQEQVRALVVGNVPDQDFQMRTDEVVEALLGLAPKLTGLRALFFGEILQEENEISWIQLCDLAPLVTALPHLEELVVRGGSGALDLRLAEHPSLRGLTVQSGGLRPDVVRDVCASGLPALEHLELWLGVEEYGGRSTAQDLAPVLSGRAFPRLRSLGLRNTGNLGSWIPVLAEAPVLSSLEVLDLSLGDLTDEGGQALVEAAPAFAHLKRLDLHHHYVSEDVCARIREALPGVEVDLSGREEPEVHDDEDGEEPEIHYYTAVSE
ncbi:STM4015 family protein [Nocardiopsis synnemataformans]|uniref:STM4015 family protein n=1 Tax=Nocardiopsis synnemataformans TaxID=61305 RepID=UPI003EC0A73F